MAGAENDNMPTDRGEPDSWTLVRQGFDEPSFTLQKHMPEIIVGRSHDCQIACAGMYQLGLGPTVVAPVSLPNKEFLALFYLYVFSRCSYFKASF